MKKTVNITLGGALFTLEEDAYAALKDYLDSVGKHFAGFDDAEEIMHDIETRIAEQLQEKTAKRKGEAVVLADVEAVIAVMGTTEDFEDEVNEELHEPWRPARRLYRNPDDEIIAGVASGIAAYFGIDPVIVRLLFVLMIFAGGWGIIIYIVMWLIMPTAQTPSQKLEMRGAPVTLKKLESSVAKAAKASGIKKEDIARGKNRVTGFFHEVAFGVRRVVTSVGPVLAAIIGGVVAFAALAGLTATTFLAATLLFNANSPYINTDFPIHEIANSAAYAVGVSAAYVVAAIPIFFILLFGVALMRRRGVLSGMATGVLIGAWMLALVALGVSAMQLGPRVEARVRALQAVQHETVTKTIVLENDFSKVALDGANRITIQPGPVASLVARGSAANLERLHVEIESDVLRIASRHRPDCFFFCDTGESVTLTLITPDIEAIALDGIVQATLREWELDVLGVELAGASQLNLGTSTIERLTAQLHGVAQLAGSSSQAQTAVVEVYDASEARVYVTESMQAKASAAAHVWWDGPIAVIVDEVTTEAGSVRRVAQ